MFSIYSINDIGNTVFSRGNTEINKIVVVFCCWVLNNVFTIYGYGTVYTVSAHRNSQFSSLSFLNGSEGAAEILRLTNKHTKLSEKIRWLRVVQRGQVKGKIPSCFLCSNTGIMSVKYKLNVKKRTKTTNYIFM